MRMLQVEPSALLFTGDPLSLDTASTPALWLRGRTDPGCKHPRSLGWSVGAVSGTWVGSLLQAQPVQF
jgi:hypothetical protein